MAKTLSELRNHTRVYLDEATAADWTDAQVNREVNYAYMKTYVSVVETYEDYYRRKQYSASVANQQEYQLPDDFYKIRRVEIKYTSDDQLHKATRFEFDQQYAALGSTSVGNSANPLYYLSGNFLGFLPIPSQSLSQAIYIWYIKQATELSDDTDEIDVPFPDRYGGLIALGAAGALLRKGQQEEAVAARYLEDFDIGLERMKQELEDRYADGTKYIIDTIGDYNDFSNVRTVTAVVA